MKQKMFLLVMIFIHQSNTFKNSHYAKSQCANSHYVHHHKTVHKYLMESLVVHNHNKIQNCMMINLTHVQHQ
eukprot:UN08074